LVRYYDPFYTRHLERIQNRIVARGGEDEIRHALAQYHASNHVERTDQGRV
jgi:hypothetical protein